MSIALTEAGVLLKQKADDTVALDKHQREFEYRYKLAIVLWRYFNGLYREALSQAQHDSSADASTSDPKQNKINRSVWIRALAKLAHAAAPGSFKPTAKTTHTDGPWQKHHLGGIVSTHNLLVDRFFSQPGYLTDSSAMRALVLSMAVTQSSLTMREMFAPLYIRTQVSMDAKHLATDMYTTCVKKQIGITDKHCAEALQHMCETFKNTVTHTFQKIDMNAVLAKYETFHAAAKSYHAVKTHTTSLTAGQALPFPEVVAYLQQAPTENDAADDFFRSVLSDSTVARAAASNVAASGSAAMMRDESSEDEEEKQHGDVAETKEEAEAAAQDDAEDAGEEAEDEDEEGEDDEEEGEDDEEEGEDDEEEGEDDEEEENDARESNESTDDDDDEPGESGPNDMEDE
jgi:hypothetical protein